MFGTDPRPEPIWRSTLRIVLKTIGIVLFVAFLLFLLSMVNGN